MYGDMYPLGLPTPSRADAIFWYLLTSTHCYAYVSIPQARSQVARCEDLHFGEVRKR